MKFSYRGPLRHKRRGAPHFSFSHWHKLNKTKPFTDEISEQLNLRFDHGVILQKLVKIDLNPGALELLDLLPHRLERDQRVTSPMREQKTLLLGHGRRHLQQPLRFVHISA